MTTVLDEKVLVLNKSWRPINVTTVRKAIILVYLDNARIVEPGTYQTHDFESWKAASIYAKRAETRLRGCGFFMNRPEVILLRNYNGFITRKVRFNRRNIFVRDQYTCQYCGRRFSSSELTLDHILPRSQGGKSHWLNIVVACYRCNIKKGGRTPEQAGMTLLRSPRKPRWEDISVKTAGDRIPESWEAFLSEMYWNIELKE